MWFSTIEKQKQKGKTMSPAIQTQTGAETQPKTPNQEFILESLKEEVVPLTSFGEGGRIISDNQVVFDEALAERFVDQEKMKPFKAEREFSNSWIQYLFQQMRQGTFRFELVTLMSAELNGVEYRINGQQTCWAVLNWYKHEYKKGSRRPVVRWIRYRCKTEEDLRLLYGTTDLGRARSRAHRIQSFIYDSPEFAGLSKPTLKLVSQSFSPWLHGFGGGGVIASDEIVYLMKVKFYNLSLLVGRFFQASPGKTSKHIRRAPVAAAMMETWHKHQADSMEFWSKVRDGAISDPLDPRLKLCHYLMSSKVNAGRGGANKSANTVDGEEMYRTCICHWNAWRKSKETGRFGSSVMVYLNGNRPVAK